MSINGISLAISIAFNTLIVLGSVAAFHVFVNNHHTKYFFAPKMFYPENQENQELPKKKYIFPLFTSLCISSDTIAKKYGIDSATKILLMQFGCALFSFTTFWCCVVLIPINATDNYVDTLNLQGGNYTDLDKTYITNITPSSPRLWAHLISIYLISIFTLTLLWLIGKKITLLKTTYQELNKSILILNIPSTSTNIIDELEKVFPPFALKYIPQQSKKTLKLYSKYSNLKIETEYLIENYNKSSKPQSKLIKPKKYGDWGTSKFGNSPLTVDKLDFNYKRLEYLRETLIAIEQKPSCAAILTFPTISNSVLTSTSRYTSQPFFWRIRKCPERDDIIWKNLETSKQRREFMNILVTILFACIILFYIPVSVAIQGLIQFEKLDTIPVISTLINLPFVSNLLKAILPSLVLTLFIMFFPAIIIALNIRSGMLTTSDVDVGLTQRLFKSNFFIVFVASFLGGTLLNEINTLINDPKQIVTVIGSSLPASATFFMTFILLNGIAGAAIAFVRIVGAIIYIIRHRITVSEQAKAKLWMNQTTMLGVPITTHTLTIMLGIIFSCQAPIIGGICLYYFILNTAFEIYNTIYVFDKIYEKNGYLWYTIFNQIMVGVYIFQLMMFLQLGLKKFIPSVVILPLILGTILYHIVIVRFYKITWIQTTLLDASNADISREIMKDEYYTPEVFELGTDKDNFGNITEAVQDVNQRLNINNIEHVQNNENIENNSNSSNSENRNISQV
jgi:hypothetical protein